jgi:hypothetical protein
MYFWRAFFRVIGRLMNFFEGIPKPREFHYVYNSRIDFVDFCLSIGLLFTSIILIHQKPIENIASVYKNFANTGVTSVAFGTYMLVIALLNIARIFAPAKPWVILSVFMKCVVLLVYSYMLFGIIGNPVLPLTTGIFFVLCLISVDNIFRTE